MPLLTILMLTFFMCLMAAKQVSAQAEPAEAAKGVPIEIRGVVVDTSGTPLQGATVSIIGTSLQTRTDDFGRFAISKSVGRGTLRVRNIGYRTVEIPFANADSAPVRVILSPLENRIEEVEVTTGYQIIPRDRATGSFEVVNNALLNHSTTTNILNRLDGITTSIKFPYAGYGALVNHVMRPEPTLRGKSGLHHSGNVLVVLDNFPYEGDINNINPNDVESITLLKDAAASSIWGARAGNGVILINTKKSGYSQPLSVSLNSSMTIGERPDIYYMPQISPKDFIGVERFLYDQGYYRSRLNNTRTYPAVNPAVYLWDRFDKGLIGEDYLNDQIAFFSRQDVRRDYQRHIYRPSVSQQYALSVRGGADKFHYRMSVGYDDNQLNLITASNRRLTLRSDASFQPVPYLEVEAGIWYTSSAILDIGPDENIQYGNSAVHPIPYVPFFDEEGNMVYQYPRVRPDAVHVLGRGRLLDWHMNPLEETKHSQQFYDTGDVLLNSAIHYRVASGMRIQARYQYERSRTQFDRLYKEESYLVRNLVNNYTSFQGDEVIRSFPIGNYYMPLARDFSLHNGRIQIDLDRSFGSHQVVALAAGEIRQTDAFSQENRFYGYHLQNHTHTNIDPTRSHPTIFGSTQFLPYVAKLESLHNRYTSILANVSYRYADRYVVSASARKDASNLFGVKSNQRSNPFWSAGILWNIHQEDFFKWPLLSELVLRTTYGYSGNTSNTVPAVPVIYLAGQNFNTGLPYASTSNPPNPNLRWEKVSMFNIGFDFALANGRVAGNIEYYDKRPTDVLASAPVDLSTGFQMLTVNSADLHVTGWDANIRAQHVQRGRFRWDGHYLFSYNRQRVTRLLEPALFPSRFVGNMSLNPIEGKDAYSVLAYRFAGLDPESGDPQGYLSGELSTDYIALTNAPLEDFQYLGTSSPRYFGSVRQTFHYGQFSIGINLQYKLGYYFMRQSINYGALFANNYGHGDFYQRWQQRGDEAHTTVPSMRYPANVLRDDFYANSTLLAERGDHVRIQTLTASYQLSMNNRSIKSLRMFITASNLGFIWRANDYNLDPDLYSNRLLPIPPSYAIGVQITY